MELEIRQDHFQQPSPQFETGQNSFEIVANSVLTADADKVRQDKTVLLSVSAVRTSYYKTI